jgi:hypothetical protein
LNRHLHIVCLDVPWPADYGAAIDMMNRIIALHALGIRIHLHYFSYNDRGKPQELLKYCDSVEVYERKKGAGGLSAQLPYIVNSRINDRLVQNLSKDDHPILLEGVHCTGILEKISPSVRKIVVRMHNDESLYYRELARSEHGWLKKLFFHRESRALKRYVHHLPPNCIYACLSKKDVTVCSESYQLPNVMFLPAFPSWQSITGEEGLGQMCLYHGNLSVPENEEAASWLLRKVFTLVKKPLVIAGKSPSRRLQKLAQLCQHTCLVPDPSEKELADLIRKAHINVLPSMQKNNTGIKFKLLHALYEGRHCVTNSAMVEGTGLEDACHIGSNASAFASIIMQLSNHPFSAEEITLRHRLLDHTYNNKENAERLIQYLW